MKTFDDEGYVLESYRLIPSRKIKYIGNFFRCYRIEKLTKSILFSKSWINSSSKDVPPVNDKEVGVRLLTIHKAKCLEFKCVFLISLNDGILPAITKTNDQLEERRLCYIAITRAKKFLQISSADYHFINEIRKRLRSSVFMSEINTPSEILSYMI